MAIVQISRITQRKGLYTDLPQPLAPAEMGWAVDERRLFIGNGTLEEGSPVVGNTEILTEYSDILNFTTGYTYQGAAAGYSVQTGASVGVPVTQSIQQRLDSFAVITDFGATGDGVTDVTAAINRALYQLYCREINPQIRRGLFFPAGIYIVTDTINIPPFAFLYGEGADSTKILFTVADWNFAAAWPAGTLVYYTATGEYYRANIAVPPNTNIGDISPSSQPYWTEEALPNYVFNTADSLQQTGANIATNGATPPKDIEIVNMAFATTESGTDSAVSHNVGLIEKASQVKFSSARFEGPFVVSDGNTQTEDLSCIRFSGSVSLPCTQINFDNCWFGGATYAVDTDEQIVGCVISSSYFDTLYQGVVLGDSTLVNGGPTGVRVMHCTFDNVYNEGIVFDTAGMNMSAYNAFYDVGNHFNGNTLAYTPVIDINSDTCASIGDLFARTTAQCLRGGSYYPRVETNNTTAIALGMNNTPAVTYTPGGVSSLTIANQMGLGTYVREAGLRDALTDNSTASLFVVDTSTAAQVQAFKMDYTILRDVDVRTGTLIVVRGKSDASGGFSYTDDYQENDSTGITLTPAEASAGGDITVSYTASSTGVNGTIHFSVTHLA